MASRQQNPNPSDVAKKTRHVAYLSIVMYGDRAESRIGGKGVATRRNRRTCGHTGACGGGDTCP